MTTALTDARLDEIDERANRACRCDDDECVADLRRLAETDVPDLTAELRRLRAELTEAHKRIGDARTMIAHLDSAADATLRGVATRRGDAYQAVSHALAMVDTHLVDPKYRPAETAGGAA